MKLIELYEQGKNGKFDCSEHMSYLKDLVLPTDTVVEIGVQFGRCSSAAFAMGRPRKHICIDILEQAQFREFKKAAEAEGNDITYAVIDSLQVNLKEMDILYIDSYHTYTQLKAELLRHGNQSKRLIVIHDTTDYCCGLRGQDEKYPGLQQAISEFVGSNPHWKVDRVVDFNNGLTTLRRV